MSHVPSQDMAPDIEEVLQTEDESAHVIPVTVCDPVEVRELPSKRIAPRTVVVSATVGTKLLSADPRRKFATIIARTDDILIGANQAQTILGAWVPGVLPLMVTTISELWAKGDGSETDVTVIEEYWA